MSSEARPLPSWLWRGTAQLSFCLAYFLSQPINGATLSLQQAVDRARETSPQIQAAAAIRKAQTEKRRSSWSEIGPRVKLDYSDVHFDEKQVIPLSPTPLVIRDDQVRTGSMTIAQPIVGLYGLVEKAFYEGTQEESRSLNLAITERDVLFRTIEVYIRAQAAAQMVQVAAASVTAAEKQGQDAEAMQRVGRMNQGDFLKLQVAVSEAKSRLAQAEAVRTIMLASLRESVGAPADTEIELEGLNATAKTKDPLPDGAMAIEQAFRANPEMRLAETSKELAGFSRKFAVTQFLPSVNFFAKYDRDFNPDTPKDKRDTKSFGIAASWDIWSNGSSVFALREAGQQIIAAEAGIIGVQQKIRLEIIQALANLKAQYQALSLAETAVNQANEAYRIEKANFTNGRSSASEMVFAEASLTGARGRQVTASAEYTIAWYQLQKTLGYDLSKP